MDTQDERRDGERGDEEEDEEIDETSYKTVKDAVLFAIDVSPSMITKPPSSDEKTAEQDNPTSAALKCAYTLMQQRIISHPKDMMGILLFGTEKSKFQDPDENNRGGLTYAHCYLLTDLDVPAATDVKKLRSLVELEEDSKDLLIPSKEPVSMADVLFCANQLFTTRASNFSSRRLFLVTDNDDPHSTDKAMRDRVRVRAKDLYDLGVTIDLFPISRPGHGFDRTKFYDDVVYRETPSDPEAPAPLVPPVKPASSGDGITLLQSLLSDILSKSMQRRALFANLPFELGPDLSISVKGYILVKRQEIGRKEFVHMHGEKPQLVKGQTVQTAETTARTVEKGEIRKAFPFGGDTVSFSEPELAALRHFGDPVLRILGFKPLSALPIWATTRPFTFIYPTDAHVVGSTRLFAALHAVLLEKQRFALAFFIARRNAAPILAALLPSKERTDPTSGRQIQPPGLWLQPLPFADDIREPPPVPTPRAPDALIDALNPVLELLRLPGETYDPARYPSPALQFHYRVLQAIALEEEMPEKPDDRTVPAYRAIRKRVGRVIAEWQRVLDEQMERIEASGGHGGVGGAAKRAAGDSAGHGGPVKRVKSEPVEDAKVQKAWRDGTLGRLTVAALRSWLSLRGLDTSGRKDALMERVMSGLMRGG